MNDEIYMFGESTLEVDAPKELHGSLIYSETSIEELMAVDTHLTPSEQLAELEIVKLLEEEFAKPCARTGLLFKVEK